MTWFKLKLLYTGQGGFYVYSVVALLFWETRRKDFGVMMGHHFVSIALIAYSYATRSFRVGSIVLALHDASDVLMESAKLLKYSGRDAAASIVFALFAFSWVALRLVYFPFWIIRSTSWEVLQIVDLSNPACPRLYYAFNSMLITLLLVHLYWWLLISRMILRQLKNRGKVGDDVRSGWSIAAC
eukprot:SM000030S11420  [mRNA]  locus=s30:514847:516083:- [translate_table: standard]